MLLYARLCCVGRGEGTVLERSCGCSRESLREWGPWPCPWAVQQLSTHQRCRHLADPCPPLSSVAPLQVVPNFRVGTIPVLGTTPAIFGLACAAYILCQLAGQPIAPEPHFRVAVSLGGMVRQVAAKM